MIVYAVTDANGNATSIFARQQSFPTVAIDDSDPKVIAFKASIAPPATCLLWQLQAVLTSAQWTAVQNYINNSGNASLIAFAQHGSNQIPANSTTLAAIAQAVGIDPATLPALVAQASAIVIP
jgi:hypothetical protein